MVLKNHRVIYIIFQGLKAAFTYVYLFVSAQFAVVIIRGDIWIKHLCVDYILRVIQVNTTHIEFQNIMTVSLSKEKIITRRDLKIIWKCVYPRHYARNTPVSVDMKWWDIFSCLALGSLALCMSALIGTSSSLWCRLSTYSLVEFSSSLRLGLTMSLYTDNSYTESYRTAIELESEDFLFFQVTLQTNNTFASDMLLQVDSCWATESPDPEDAVKGVLLEDG